MKDFMMIAFLLTGAVFAALATWLTTQKGNRVQDILRSDRPDLEALKIEVGKFKMSSNTPIVALYVVAIVVAIGPIIYWMYLGSTQVTCDSKEMSKSGLKFGKVCYEIWHVSGKLSNYQGLQQVQFAVNPPGFTPYANGDFEADVPVAVSEQGPALPTITFVPISIDHARVVHLQTDTMNHNEYTQRVNGKVIVIETPIDFAKVTQ